MMASAREFLPTGGRSILSIAKPSGANGSDSLDYPVIKVGMVGNVTVCYDPSLGAPGLALANQMLDVVAEPYRDMQSFFGVPGGPVTLMIVPRSGAHDGSGGAYHYGCDFTSGGVLYCDATFASRTVDPLQLQIGLYVAGLSECFMGAQGRGWGKSNGAGLARFLAQYETAAGTLDAFATGPHWGRASFPDWLSQTEPTDQNPVSIGCAIVYLHWLRSIGFTIPQIVRAGGSTLQANYQILTDKTSAYQDLYAALNGLPVTGDNPFGTWLQQPGMAVIDNTLHVAWKGGAGDDAIYWASTNGTNWTPPERVANVGTSTGPALAAINSTLFMAWKGAGRDERIFWSSSCGANWTPRQAVPNVASNVGPKLAVLNGHLYMAWKGSDGDPSIYWSSLTGTTWAPRQRIANSSSAFGPALGVFENQLHAVWRGGFDDETLWWSSFHGAAWTPQRQIPSATSSEGPTFAIYHDALYAIWKGGVGDRRLWLSKFNGSSWTAPQAIPGLVSSNGPGIAAFDNGVYAVWRGEPNDDRLWWSKLNGASWTLQQVIPGFGNNA
jgi:hypothetical protein